MEKLELKKTEKPRPTSERKRFIIYAIALILIIALAFIVGYFIKHKKPKCSSGSDIEAKEKFYQQIVDKLEAKNLEENLQYFAGKPHAAASPRNNELIKEIYRRFQSYGFDAQYHPYDVLLSFTKPKKKNHVYILDNAGNQTFKSKGIEKFLEPSENETSAYPPFHGNSPNGTVEGELVYANYGRYEDFEELQDKYGINVSGKIVIVKYGKLYRGDKVFNAQNRGAIGVIIYSDPKDYAPEGKKFIEGRWLPDDGVQRGSILKKSYLDVGEGDPLTPGYPAKSWVYRPHPQEVKGLPKIPSQPVSADDAYHLMKDLGGMQVDAAWRGSLNISYNVGPHKINTTKVKLEVLNEREVKTITNVCGTIKGELEPDRYVMLGNHVDAWVFGAVDPSSGTSVMMEIARALGEEMKSGWKPRRTIKLCGWDGEEFGLLGSSEYVEEFRNQLRDRAVAYINVDSAVNGNESLVSAASPLLHQMMFDAHKKVPDPFNEKMTVFDRCKELTPDKDNQELHKINSLGSGSDYTAFYQFLGIPSLDISYQQTKMNRRLKTSFYPVYHSLHDTIYWMKNFVDHDFKVHLTIARVAMQYLLHLADSDKLPLDVQRYDDRIKKDTNEFTEKLRNAKQTIDTGPLERAATEFSAAVKEFLRQNETVDIRNPVALRIFNDRLIQMEKGFIYVNGLPGRPYLKHYIMAPSKYNNYASSQFPAISDTLHEAEISGDWDELKKQLSITAYLINNVADNLRSVT